MASWCNSVMSMCNSHNNHYMFGCCFFCFIFSCFSIQHLLNHSIFCCWFLCPTFSCVSVWWSPISITYFAVGFSAPLFLMSCMMIITTIIYFAVGFSVALFLVPLCGGHNNHYIFCCLFLCSTFPCDGYQERLCILLLFPVSCLSLSLCDNWPAIIAFLAVGVSAAPFHFSVCFGHYH